MSRREELVLESYFESLDSGEIRVKGTRVGIEIVLRDYLQGAGPEEIVLRYSTLSLERVHATILHYLCNTEGLNKAPSGLAADLQPAASGGLLAPLHPPERNLPRRRATWFLGS